MKEYYTVYETSKFIKAICACMFDDETPVDLTPPIDTYFKLFKKSFDLTITRIKSGSNGGSKKKKEIINKKNIMSIISLVICVVGEVIMYIDLFLFN